MVKRSGGRKSSRFSLPGSVMFTPRSAPVARASGGRGSPFPMTCTTRRDDSPRGGGRQPTAPALASTAASAIGNEEPPVHIHGRPTVAEVSLGALRHNCRRVRELVGPGVAVLAGGEGHAPRHRAGPAARALLPARPRGPRGSRGPGGAAPPPPRAAAAPPAR